VWSSAHARSLRSGLGSRGASRPLRTPDLTSSNLLVTGEDSARRSIALLFDEPAGVIATRTAGVVEFGATLAWQSPEDVPPGPLLPDLQSAARCSITENEGPETATRCLVGEIRALKQAELASTLEAVLRTVTEVAAIKEAMLEVGAVRTVPLGVPSARALEELARDIGAAGFRVRFGPSWTPGTGADVCVGVGGDGELQDFLRSHPAWSIA
jgi:hypothetical protein